MSDAESFKTFFGNIQIPNDAQISNRYGEITRALNKAFRETESTQLNSLQVGSYGRKSGIKGISDLDMLYVMPKSCWPEYEQGGQSKLLQKCAAAISERYPSTTVRVDRLVVQVLYQNFTVEVQPVFELADQSYKYPDTYAGGSWKITKPRAEMSEMSLVDEDKNGNLRRLSKLARAWKNKHGVGLGGLVIDTFAYRFLNQTSAYDKTGFSSTGEMARDFFEYLAGQPKLERIHALGSNQWVKIRGSFHRKARKAHEMAEDALETEGKRAASEKWRKILGRAFPSAETELSKAYLAEKLYQFQDTEEFVEDLFPIDVRYSLRIDCEVTQAGFRTFRLLEMIGARLPLFTKKSLKFYVRNHNIPGEFSLWWKVLNRGPEAERRDCIRGQIKLDSGQLQNTETTDFRGDHIVECYATKNGVVVARDRIIVPIVGEAE